MARFVFEDETPAAPVSRFVFEDAGEAPPRIGGVESALRSGYQGLTLGWGEELDAGLAAALPFLDRGATAPAKPGDADTLGGRYRRALGRYRGRYAAAREANPTTSQAAELIGAAVPALVTAGGSTVAQGAGLGTRMLAGMRAATPLGFAYGAGTSEATDLPGLMRDAAVGGLAAGVLGGAAPAVGSALGRAGGALKRLSSTPAPAAAQGGAASAGSASTIIVRPPKRTITERVMMEPEPIPEAQQLLGRGVRLTKGMYDPKSGRSLVELASTSRPGAGPLIMKQRAQALDDAMDLAFKEAVPPGAQVKLSGDINTKYSALKDAWDASYDAIRSTGELIYPAIHNGKGGAALRGTSKAPGVLDQVIGDAGEIWDRESRAIAKRFVDNEMSRLPTPKGALGRVDLGDMLKVLSKVKEKGREALRAQKYDLHQIMGRVQDALEQTVESQASPETSAALKALNGKYRDFKVIEDMVVRAGDSPLGVTPARLSAAVKAGEPSRSRYAAGGGGPLRELSQAIGAVFDESASPRTGARLLAAAPSWAHSGLIGPTIYLRNAAAVRAAGGSASGGTSMLGRVGNVTANKLNMLGGVTADAGPASAITLSPRVSALLKALRGRPGVAPAAAEEEAP
jgi:hypothetical protein